MKNSITILMMGLFVILSFDVKAQTNIEKVEINNEDCADFHTGSIGFKNPTSDTLYVILVKSSSNIKNLVSHFTIPQDSTKWQYDLVTGFKRSFFYYVFDKDPGKKLGEIQNDDSFLYKGNIFLKECENKLVTIKY